MNLINQSAMVDLFGFTATDDMSYACPAPAPATLCTGMCVGVGVGVGIHGC